MSNQKIQKDYTLHHTSKVDGYDISHASSNKDGHVATFIHHNGNHVGTIYGKAHADGKKGFRVTSAGLHKDHQGKKLMPKVYAHLVTKHDHEIHSDNYQSKAGHSIWKTLSKTPGVKVDAHVHNSNRRKIKGETVPEKPKFNDDPDKLSVARIRFYAAKKE